MELRRLNYREITRLLAFENTPRVHAKLTIDLADAGTVANQTTGFDELAYLEDRWHCVARRQRYDLVSPAVEERVADQRDRANASIAEGREDGFQFAVGAGVENADL